MNKKLLKFEAEWCGACKALTPTLTNVMKEFPDIDLVKIDCEDNDDLVSKYGIRNIPALIYLIDDKEVGRLTGAVPTDKIKELLNGLLV